jgi:hypothetical protein
MDIATGLIYILIGIALLSMSIAVGYLVGTKSCPKQEEKIITKYIPRTFVEEQMDPTKVSDVFKLLFEQRSPWLASVTTIDNNKIDQINKNYVSQA